MGSISRKDQLTRQLMASQSRLYAYIVTLVHDPDRAHDILQNANVIMLGKLDELDAATEFLPWAYRVAYFEVLSARRDLARDRHQFSESFVETLADAAASRAGRYEDRTRALYHCLDQLAPDQRKIIEKRYMADGSVESLAAEMRRPYGSVRQSLYRIRMALVDCVRRQMATEEHA